MFSLAPRYDIEKQDYMMLGWVEPIISHNLNSKTACHGLALF